MNLEDLKKEMPFKWRVQSCNKHGAKCVAYIDARDVQDMLDSVCGQENWSVSYSEFKGNLFATIGIKTDKGTTFKSDCGTESNVEKQKGEASDAFKRAGVMWGIGRFLYSKKMITIKEVQQNGNRYEPTENGQKIWDITKYCNTVGNKKPSNKPKKLEPKATPKKEKLTPEQLAKTLLADKKQIQNVINMFDLDDSQLKQLNEKIK